MSQEIIAEIGLTPTQLWLAVLALGLVTYAMRFSFVGLLGGYEFPPWALRLLKYVPVTVLPALVAPGFIWTGPGPEDMLDPARLFAALLTLGIGIWSRRANVAFIMGLAALVLFVNWPF